MAVLDFVKNICMISKAIDKDVYCRNFHGSISLKHSTL